MKRITIQTLFIAAAALTASLSARADVTDVTSTYVTNYNFSGDQSAWNIETNDMYSTSQSNYCQEFWNGSVSSCWFKMSQTLTNLPDGVYRLTINAFTRAGGESYSQTAIYASTSSQEKLTSIWLRHADTSYGSEPDAMSSAYTAFYSSAGNYWLNTVDNIVVTDGTLTIGARNVGQLKTGTTNGTWTILGNVKLYQLTGSDLAGLMDSVITVATTLAATNGTGASTLSTAISTAEDIADDDLTLDAIQTLEAAMDTYRSERMADAVSEETAVDVSYLITNPGFEDGATYVLGVANGCYSQPVGWTMTYGDTHVNNNAGIASSTIEQASYGSPVTPTEGNYAYAMRMRWTSSSYIQFAQTVSLPAGSYTLSADLAMLGSTDTGTLTATSSDGTTLATLSPSTAALSTVTADAFVLHSTTSVTLTVNLTQSGQTNALLGVDNICLTYYNNSDLHPEEEAKESNISLLNKLLTVFIDDFNNKAMEASKWETLIDCVAAAETAKDNDESTSTDIQTAYDNLYAAMYGDDAAETSIAAYASLEGALNTVGQNETALAVASFQELVAAAQTVYDTGSQTTEEVNETVSNLMAAYLEAILTSTDESTSDMTSYIANPSFELGESASGTDAPYVIAPTSWEVEYSSTASGDIYKHLRCPAYGETYDGQAPDAYQADEAGDNYLYIRANWDAASPIRTYQTITLPEGNYRLSVDIEILTNMPTTNYTYVQVGDDDVLSLLPSTTGAWETVTQDFEVAEGGESVTISFGFATTGGNYAVKLLADNLKLTFTEPEDVSLYKQAVNLYNALSTTTFTGVAGTLSSAIDKSEDEDGNPSYTLMAAALDDLENAVKWGTAAQTIDTTTGDASGLIDNTDATSGTSGWTVSSNVSTLSSEYYKAEAGAYFDGGSWSSTGWTASMSQTILLPAGYYSLSAIGRCNTEVTLTMSLNGTSVTFPAVSATGGNLWEYAAEDSEEYTQNSSQGYGWSRRYVGIYLDEDTEAELAVSSSTSAQYQWFSIDEFALTYAAEAGTVTTSDDNRLTISGAVNASDIVAAAGEETRSIDLRDATVMVGTPSWSSDMNPNCMIYAPVGLLEEESNVICDDICLSLDLTDAEPFNVPEAFTAKSAEYIRPTYHDGLYETLIVPFDTDLPDTDSYSVEEVGEETETSISTEVTTDTQLEAGKAYLLRYIGTTSDEKESISYTGENVTISTFTDPIVDGLFGSTDKYTVTEDDEVYMLSATDGTFKIATAGSWSSPFRACFKSGYTTASANLNIFILGEETGIQGVEADADGEDNTPVDVYDLEGRIIRQQVPNSKATEGLKSGIYIINHKKVTVK